MSTLSHLGKNIGVIHSMGYADGNNIKGLVNKSKNKYLMAITANCCQQDSAAALKKNGFKDYLTFYSSHGRDETLTLWVKIRNKFKNSSKAKISLPDHNCSVDYHNHYVYQCNIATKKLDGYEKIKNTPIYYRIKNENLVKPKKVKIIKLKMKKMGDIWK